MTPARERWCSAVLVGLSSFVYSCDGAADGGDFGAGVSTSAVTVRDSAGVEVVTIETAPSSLPEWEVDTVLVTIDGSSPALSFVLDALWMSDGRIVIPDLRSNLLHVYDASGAYQRSLGGAGDGPGELRRIRTASIGRGDTISVFDFADGPGGTLQMYHPDDGFLVSVALPATDEGGGRLQGWNWGAGSYLGFVQTQGTMAQAGPALRRRPTTSVIELLGDGAPAVPAVQFQGSYSGVHASGMDVRLPFTHRPLVVVAPDRLLYGTGQRFELRELDRSLALRRIMRWPSLRRPLDDEDIGQARSEWLARQGETGDPESMRMILDVMFAPALLPKDRPAIGKALFDDEGRIWVARFEPFVFTETLYYVLEPNGEPVARVRIPAEKRALLSGVRGDRVLLAGRDALDIPRIELARLRKPLPGTRRESGTNR